jgi:hypothetical protein
MELLQEWNSSMIGIDLGIPESRLPEPSQENFRSGHTTSTSLASTALLVWPALVYY